MLIDLISAERKVIFVQMPRLGKSRIVCFGMRNWVL